MLSSVIQFIYGMLSVHYLPFSKTLISMSVILNTFLGSPKIPNLDVASLYAAVKPTSMLHPAHTFSLCMHFRDICLDVCKVVS